MVRHQSKQPRMEMERMGKNRNKKLLLTTHNTKKKHRQIQSTRKIRPTKKQKKNPPTRPSILINSIVHDRLKIGSVETFIHKTHPIFPMPMFLKKALLRVVERNYYLKEWANWFEDET